MTAGAWESTPPRIFSRQDRRQGEAGGQSDEQANLDRDPVARETGGDHQTSADPAEYQEDRQKNLGRLLAHATVPRELTSTPRAISRWDRTGRDENMRSTIMRT